MSVNKRLSRSIDRKFLQYKLVNIYCLQCFRKLHVCIACWCVCPYPFTYGAFSVKLQNWHIFISSSIFVCFFKIWHIQSLLLDDEMKSIVQEKDRENHTTINLYIVYAMHSLYYFIRVHLSLSVKKFFNESAIKCYFLFFRSGFQEFVVCEATSSSHWWQWYTLL